MMVTLKIICLSGAAFATLGMAYCLLMMARNAWVYRKLNAVIDRLDDFRDDLSTRQYRRCLYMFGANDYDRMVRTFWHWRLEPFVVDAEIYALLKSKGFELP